MFGARGGREFQPEFAVDDSYAVDETPGNDPMSRRLRVKTMAEHAGRGPEPCDPPRNATNTNVVIAAVHAGGSDRARQEDNGPAALVPESLDAVDGERPGEPMAGAATGTTARGRANEGGKSPDDVATRAIAPARRRRRARFVF